MKIKSLSVKLRAEQEEVSNLCLYFMGGFLSLCVCVQVRRLKASMQYKEAQHSHEMRKREKEYSRLKVKLGQVLIVQCMLRNVTLTSPSSQLVSDRSHERRLGLSVLNDLQRSGGKRKLWDQPGRLTNSFSYQMFPYSYSHNSYPSSVEDTYRAIVGSYEERQKVHTYSQRRECGLVSS